MKGKPWTVEEERKLAQLVEEHKPLNVIAETLKKTRMPFVRSAIIWN